MARRAFTLVELLVVIAIMGMMGAISVGGYRAMRRGMEEKGVMRTVNHFIRAAYQRAQIDRAPVDVYLWNETLAEDSGDAVLTVVGKAVAVRRSGRVTKVVGNHLVDEFGDLYYSSAEMAGLDARAASATDSGMYIYKMGGTSGSQMQRSVVNTVTEKYEFSEPMIASGDEVRAVTFSNMDRKFHAYAYYLSDKGSATWKSGDAYGFEFAEIELPKGYIFGSTFSRSVMDPVAGKDVLRFKVSQNSGSGATAGTSGRSTVTVSSLRPDASGKLAAQKVEDSADPKKRIVNI